MAKQTLTDPKLRKTKPPEKGEIILTDTSGLTCRIRYTGQRTFGWRYRDAFKDGKLSRVEYGDYPARSLADARDIHKAVKAARSNGEDVKQLDILNRIIATIISNHAEQQAVHEDGLRFESLVNQFFDDYIRTNDIDERSYNRIKNHVLPTFKHHNADKIPETEIKQWIKDKRSAGKGVSTKTLNDTLRFTNAMYTWAIDNHLCAQNPFLPFKPKRTDASRDVFYTAQEVRILLRNDEDYSISDDNLYIQKGLLLTGTRSSELIHAKVSEFNFNTGLWTIPASRLKNQKRITDKKDFQLPMSTQFSILIQEAIAKFGNSEYVFGSKQLVVIDGIRQKKPTGVLSDRNWRNYIRDYRSHYNIADRINHDWRRTLETHLSDLFVPDHITTAMTGHSRKGMKKVYNRAQQLIAFRIAFQLWADFIDFIRLSNPEYAIAFDDKVMGKELKEIYSQFNFNQKLIAAFEIFEGS